MGWHAPCPAPKVFPFAGLRLGKRHGFSRIHPRSVSGQAGSGQSRQPGSSPERESGGAQGGSATVVTICDRRRLQSGPYLENIFFKVKNSYYNNENLTRSWSTTPGGRGNVRGTVAVRSAVVRNIRNAQFPNTGPAAKEDKKRGTAAGQGQRLRNSIYIL